MLLHLILATLFLILTITCLFASAFAMATLQPVAAYCLLGAGFVFFMAMFAVMFSGEI